MTELLAPAGGQEALIAAVQNGADAVYMGFGDFNARRNARNFSAEDFAAAVRYCHLRGVKVYLTLNTLLSDRELPALAETARQASEFGVDAILVQDLGVWKALREVIPDVPLHASTQLSVHTLSGVKMSAELGFTRAVLARELSRSDIAEIAEKAPIEIETFVHGALCMCYSGQCEMSALIGGRSGNRGLCAQPCRLPYGFHGKADGYPLSLKDMNLAPYAGEMADLGVACLKLEGRMKRPEYVAAIVGIYSRLLREKRQPTAQEQRQLTEAFSRSGFTEDYYLGKRGKAMFGTRPESARWPEEWFSELRADYEKEDMRTVSVRFDCSIRENAPMELFAVDENGFEGRAVGPVPEAARNRALTEEEVTARLSKTGGTVFRVSDCAVALDDGLAVSASALNALRRDALAALEQARCAMPPRRSLALKRREAIKNSDAAPRISVSIARREQLSAALIDEGVALVYFPVELIDSLDLAPYLEKTEFCAVLPRIYRTKDEKSLVSLLKKCEQQGVMSVAIGNLGHLALARETSLRPRGDFGLNVFNSLSLEVLRDLGLTSATLSPELRKEQLRDLNKCLPCEAIVYGRLPLMITENCIIAANLGCKFGASRCDAPTAESRCEQTVELTDRKGETFPVLRVYGCRNEIQNGKTLYLTQKDFRGLGLSFARLRFTTETADECVRILRAYHGREDHSPTDFTRGLFLRGVE